MIKSAGYRVGPAEIENCLLKHAAVANAAVIGVPDRERGEVIRACIVLTAGTAASEAAEPGARAGALGLLPVPARDRVPGCPADDYHRQVHWRLLRERSLRPA
jgi:acyl-CoA synthetase (AMP-forming)/AMP-acid ligase II